MGLTSFAAKTISIILAFLLCFSLCPVYAYAETENLSKETIEQSVPNTDSDSLESDRNANSSDNSKIDELQGETASDKTVDNSAEKNTSEPKEQKSDSINSENIATSSQKQNDLQSAEDTEAVLSVSELIGTDSFEFTQQSNTTNVVFAIPNAQEILDSKLADAVSVKAIMQFDGKTTRSVAEEFSLSELTKDGKSLDFTAYGKYEVSIAFLKDDKTVSTFDQEVNIIANEYNIAPLGGTLPVTLFSLQLWDITHTSNGTVIPTMVLLERPSSYNWENLPSGVYPMPTLTEKEISTGSSDFGVSSDLFRDRAVSVQAYIKDLFEGNPNAHINLYVSDYYVGLVQSLIYANQIPEGQYTIHLLSDGSFSASSFNSTYASASPQATHDSLVGAWKNAKEEAYRTGKTPSGYRLGESSSSSRCYAAYSVESGYCTWDVARSDLFTAGDGASGEFTQQARSSLTQLSIANMLTSLQAKGESVVQEFKSLYDFSGEYFSKA